MSSIWTTKYVLDQHGGGINVLDDDTSIADNEWVEMENFDVLGNRMVAPLGYEKFFTFWNTSNPIQGLSVFGEFVFAIQNWKLFIHNTSNWTTYPDNTTWFDFLNTTWQNFNITINKFLDTIAIVICEQDGLDSIKVVELSSSFILSNKSLTWFSGNPTCSIFYNGQLLLGWVIGKPWVLYYSKPYDPLQSTIENSIYKFDVYPAGFQAIGDGTPITWFNYGNQTLYIGKRNSIWKVTWFTDNATLASPTFKFDVTPISGTWPLNQEVFISVMQDTFYYDGNAVRRLSYEANTLALKDAAISNYIQPIIESLPTSQLNATSLFIYPYYKIFLRNELSNVNNIGLVYNVINKSWRIQSGITVLHSASGYKDNSIAYFGDVFNWNVYKDNVSYTYDWGNIARRAKTKSFDYNDRVQYKRFFQTEVSGEIQYWMKVYVDILVDNIVVDTREINSTPTDYLLPATTWASTIGSTTSGAADKNTWDIVTFTERYEMYNDGRIYALVFRTEDIGFFQLHTRSCTNKKLKTSNYDIHY